MTKNCFDEIYSRMRLSSQPEESREEESSMARR